MTHKKEIVITGAGVVSPIGIGQEAFWASLCRRPQRRARVGYFCRSRPDSLWRRSHRFRSQGLRSPTQKPQGDEPRHSIGLCRGRPCLHRSPASRARNRSRTAGHRLWRRHDPLRTCTSWCRPIAVALSTADSISTVGARRRWPKSSRFGCSSICPTCPPATSASPKTPAGRTIRSPWATFPACRRRPRR